MRPGYPPCRRFRSVFHTDNGGFLGYPPCRRFRRPRGSGKAAKGSYPPCRRFRRQESISPCSSMSYPPCRRFRRQRRERLQSFCSVIRRVGGLEDTGNIRKAQGSVIRRVGGLEVLEREGEPSVRVIRRVGGLENQAGGCPPKAPSSRLGLFTSTLDIDSFIWREWQKGRRTCLNIF